MDDLNLLADLSAQAANASTPNITPNKRKRSTLNFIPYKKHAAASSNYLNFQLNDIEMTDYSSNPSNPPNRNTKLSRQQRQGKVQVSIEKNVHQLLSTVKNSHKLQNKSEAILFLAQKPIKADESKPKSDPCAKICFMQTDALANLQPYLFCPTHKTQLKMTIQTVDHVPVVDLCCSECKTSFYWEGSARNSDYSRRKESPYLVNNQVIFACTLANIGLDQYEIFSKGLCTKSVSSHLFSSRNTHNLRLFTPLHKDQLILIRKFLTKKKDLNMITDGTYSHRRNAQWCVVPFMSHVYNLIFYVKVGNQKELKKTANQLEFEISKQALIEISKMEDFKMVSLTHDEHIELCKWLTERLNKGDLFNYSLEEYCDFWHKNKSLDKTFLKFAVGLGDQDKGQIQEIIRGLRYYFKECKAGCRGSGDDFYEWWKKVPSKFQHESAEMQSCISKFGTFFVPEEKKRHYASDFSTSPMEGFNGYNHRINPKKQIFHPLC